MFYPFCQFLNVLEFFVKHLLFAFIEWQHFLPKPKSAVAPRAHAHKVGHMD